MSLLEAYTVWYLSITSSYSTAAMVIHSAKLRLLGGDCIAHLVKAITIRHVWLTQLATEHRSVASRRSLPGTPKPLVSA
jgi:hypothetical protein